MKIVLNLLFLLFTSSLFSQEKLSVNKSIKFNKKNTITVISRDKFDPLDVTGKLENLLLGKEFDVVSEDVAISKSKRNVTKNSNGSTEESFNSIDVKSVYVFKYKYAATTIPPRWMWQKEKYIITEMSGNIVDLANDGKLVATFTYSNKSTSYSKAKEVEVVLESLLEKLLN